MKSLTKLFSLTILGIFLSISTCAQKTPDAVYSNVSVHKIQSEILNEERTIFIYLPEDYSTNKDYPILYILDGHRPDYFDKAFAAFNDDKVGKHIIVGINTKENRNRDMIPVKMETRPTAGGGENFLKFLESDLKPYINKNYKSNGFEILYGGSTAGLFVIYAILNSPNLMDGYIASSPMVGHCPEYMNNKLKTVERSHLKNKILFIYYGMQDQFTQVTEYLPDYCTSIEKELGDSLIYDSKSFENKGHVPPESLEKGLDYIHQNKK